MWSQGSQVKNGGLRRGFKGIVKRGLKLVTKCGKTTWW